jgi:hypothetical protein
MWKNFLGPAVLAFAAPAAAQAPEPTNRSAPADGAERIDLARLWSDPTYAASQLGRAEAALARGLGTAEAEAAAHALRAAALATLDRDEESAAALGETFRREPARLFTYQLAFMAADRLQGHERLLELVTLSVRRVPAEQRERLRRLFSADSMIWLSVRLQRAGDRENYGRLAEALVEIGWPPPGDTTVGDMFRVEVLDRRLASGDRGAAARIAATIGGPEAMQVLLTHRSYEGLIPAWSRPTEALAEAYARHDRETREAVAAEPNLRSLLLRARLLRALGREAEVAALLPAAGAEAAYAADPQGSIVLHHGAQALLALGRTDDAVALSASHVAADAARGGSAVASAVRHAELLWQAGRAAESIDLAARLLRERDADLTDYSRPLIRSALSCALRVARRHVEAEVQLAELRRIGHPAALTRALLCANRLDEAEALLVQRLRAAEPGAILAVQDYRTGGAAVGRLAQIHERLRALRRRPAVVAAMERAGRIVQVPAALISSEVF